MGLGQVALLERVGAVEAALGGRVRLLRLTAWLPALAVLLISATARPTASIGLVLVAGVAGMGRPPVFSGALNARIPSEERATVFSAVSAARTLSIGLVYLAVGPLVDRSLVAGLAFVGALGVAAALFAAAPARLFAESAGTASPADPS